MRVKTLIMERRGLENYDLTYMTFIASHYVAGVCMHYSVSLYVCVIMLEYTHTL